MLNQPPVKSLWQLLQLSAAVHQFAPRGFLGLPSLPFTLEKSGDSLQILLESCSGLQKTNKNPATFSAPLNNSKCTTCHTGHNRVYSHIQHIINSWEPRLPSDTRSFSSAQGQQIFQSLGRDHGLSTSIQPAHKGRAVPQHFALPRRQKLSAQGKLDFTSLSLGVCFRKSPIPESSFRIYPNCSVRCRTEPSGYVCLGWSKAFISPPLLLLSKSIFLKALEFFNYFCWWFSFQRQQMNKRPDLS